MKTIQQFLLRHVISLPVSFTVWFILLIATNLGFLVSTGLLFVVYGATNFAMKQLQIHSTLKQFGLTRSEYRYISEQLDLAKDKIKSLNSHYGKVRSAQDFKQLHATSMLARKIIQTVKNNPTKFYAAEKFFYAHLDSAVHLTSKYALLSNQPLKDEEIQSTLMNTRQALHNVYDQFETDLRKALSSDMESLKFEIDYVDATMKRQKKQLDTKGDHQ